MGKFNLKPSTISSKVVMAIAGLFLMTFLIVHLGINMLMLLGDEGNAFGKAVSFMTYNPGIKIFEYVLFGGFIIHMIIGALIEVKNYFARPVKYAVSNNSNTSFFSKYMIHTGILIFIFLILHFTHFFFVKLKLVELPACAAHEHDFFTITKYLFKSPYYAGIYIICFIFLGLHLNHAFQSAFQTLGLNHPKYTPAIKVISSIYAIGITLGFSMITLYFYFFYTL
ncbi:MAG: succinate dehydrogenase cytochrome b subunit [Bacteroidales bacterium]|nr:succinate dehydrogenase cytochrome b subunit [Bacteroidales bacterium]